MKKYTKKPRKKYRGLFTSFKVLKKQTDLSNGKLAKILGISYSTAWAWNRADSYDEYSEVQNKRLASYKKDVVKPKDEVELKVEENKKPISKEEVLNMPEFEHKLFVQTELLSQINKKLAKLIQLWQEKPKKRGFFN